MTYWSGGVLEWWSDGGQLRAVDCEPGLIT
jgi:hypothetical protein